MCVNQPVMCFQQLTASWTIYYHHGKIHYSIRQLCAQPELRRATSPAWQQPSRDPNAAGLSSQLFILLGRVDCSISIKSSPQSYTLLSLFQKTNSLISSERCCKSLQQVGTLQITTDGDAYVHIQFKRLSEKPVNLSQSQDAATLLYTDKSQPPWVTSILGIFQRYNNGSRLPLRCKFL